MKNLKMSIFAFAVAAAVFAAGFAVSTGNTSAEGPVVTYIFEDLIECS